MLVSAAYLGLSLKQALLATVLGGADRLRDARRRRADRRRRARADDGAPARAARAARLLPRDRAQRPAVPRLVDLRADHHRDRGVRARRPGVRLRRALVLEAPLRRSRDRARAARADRLRPPLRPQVRDLGRRRARSSTSPGGSRRTADLHRLWNVRRQRRLVLRRDGSDHRAQRLVDPARRRLHALLDRPPRRVLGRRARLPLPDAVPVRLRRDPRALASVDLRADGRADDDRGGRRRELPRAARADGRRDRRGVREHLLDRDVDPELRAAARRSACSSSAARSRRRSARSRST